MTTREPVRRIIEIPIENPQIQPAKVDTDVGKPEIIEMPQPEKVAVGCREDSVWDREVERR